VIIDANVAGIQILGFSTFWEENRLFFVDEGYEQGLPLDENESFYIGKSIAGLKLNPSAQNPIIYLNPQ